MKQKQEAPKNHTPVRTNPLAMDKKSIEYRQAKNRTMVTGIFKDFEVKNGILSFSYGPEFKGDRTETYHLTDGERYTIPYGVAWHLNNRCYYQELEHRPNEEFINGVNPYQNSGNTRVSKKVHRFGFIGLDFSEDDLNPTPDLFVANNSL